MRNNGIGISCYNVVMIVDLPVIVILCFIYSVF